VREAVFDVVRFWVDRGVDGFRLDAINWLGKDTRWPDNPWRLAWRSYYRQIHRYDRDQPHTHEALRALRQRWLRLVGQFLPILKWRLADA